MNLKGLYLVTPDYMDDGIFDIVRISIEHGASILQYRDKSNNYTRKIYAGKKFRKIADEYNIPLIVDDDPVLMDIIDADGIHIGRDDVPFDYIKGKYPDRIIGVSTYGDIKKAKEYEKLGADYVAFGSFFSTETKKDATLCYINILNDIGGIKIPVFLIGGINLNNLEELLKYKISGVAVVSSIFSSSDPAESTISYMNKLKQYGKI